MEVFRWNVDLWDQYETVEGSNVSAIRDPVGRSVDLLSPELYLLWRKPFTELMRFENPALENADRAFARNQAAQWMRAIVASMRVRNAIRLVEPYADARLPKLFQLRVAAEFFRVPDYQFSTLSRGTERGDNRVVTKPLGSPEVGEKIFYTRLANADALVRPYPWFTQQAIVGGTDITCVYILGQCHFFSCDFPRDEGRIDWRVEINRPGQSQWHQTTHADVPRWGESVVKFMRELGLHYGRLDFILLNGVLYFLECNSNGQFGWLDSSPEHPLHQAFLRAALSPESAVRHS